MITKQKLYDTLGAIEGDNLTDFYDNLMWILETLRDEDILDNDAYEEADKKLCEIFGYNYF